MNLQCPKHLIVILNHFESPQNIYSVDFKVRFPDINFPLRGSTLETHKTHTQYVDTCTLHGYDMNKHKNIANP